MIDEHDVAEHRRDLGLDEELCQTCRVPLETSWIDGVKECTKCVGIKQDADFRAEMKRLERENRPRRRR